MDDYKKIKNLEDVEIPNKKELINMLQKHDLYYEIHMSKKELWDILATYFNAREEFILIARDEDKESQRQELLEYMTNLKNPNNQ